MKVERKPLRSRLKEAFTAARAALAGKPVFQISGQSRFFNGADVSRLNLDWIVSRRHIDEEVRRDLPTLRSRSRDLGRNNPYFDRYLGMLATNVIGPHGIRFKATIRDASGALNTKVNEAVEGAHRRYAKTKVTVDGRLTLQQFRVLGIRTLAQDGECIIRIYRGFPGNIFGLGLQFMDPDQLDDTFNVTKSPEQNEVRMGVEINEWGAPVAYWFRDRPAFGGGWGERYRVESRDILHVYKSLRPNQTRGIPWCHSVMLSMGMLDGFEEAYLVAARLGAAIGGWFQTERKETDDDPDPNRPPLLLEANPGSFRELPKGVTFKEFNPQHPSPEGPSFVKQFLRRIATGFGVFFNALANDAESVTYSTWRGFKLQEYDDWKTIQKFWEESVEEPLFSEWLPLAVFSKQLKLPTYDVAAWSSHEWMFHRWPWVDPLRDVQATVLALQHRLTSPQREMADQCMDPHDVMRDWQEWGQMAEKYGVALDAPALTSVNDAPAEGEDPNAPKNDTSQNGTGKKAHPRLPAFLSS